MCGVWEVFTILRIQSFMYIKNFLSTKYMSWTVLVFSDVLTYFKIITIAHTTNSHTLYLKELI